MLDGNLLVKISEATVSPLTRNLTKSMTSKKFNRGSCTSMGSKKAQKQLDGKSIGIVHFALCVISAMKITAAFE